LPIPDPTPPAGYDQLTAREREVLFLLSQAHSNAEIAALLYISEATVKTHTTRVLMKLGLRDRAQAIVLAHRHGLDRPT
ncbi:response regulator transcription factor, partial [Streptomyces flavofungini]|uniref:response regulator transcription factor n=1 Tax=Streptomyces flavofungini TaxID=68200 RepID=UPI0034DF6880